MTILTIRFLKLIHCVYFREHVLKSLFGDILEEFFKIYFAETSFYVGLFFDQALSSISSFKNILFKAIKFWLSVNVISGT